VSRTVAATGASYLITTLLRNIFLQSFSPQPPRLAATPSKSKKSRRKFFRGNTRSQAARREKWATSAHKTWDRIDEMDERGTWEFMKNAMNHARNLSGVVAFSMHLLPHGPPHPFAEPLLGKLGISSRTPLRASYRGIEETA
jgi:hypothetical protein